MHGLQYLFLQSLPHVGAIPDLTQLTELRRLYLENMKGLSDIGMVAKAPALEEMIHVCAQGMEPEQYVELLKSKTLKQITVGFGSARKNAVLRSLADDAGIASYEGNSFVFR
jgi:hypothetical protein